MRTAVVNGFLNRLRKVGHFFSSSQPCLLKVTSCQPRNSSKMCSSTNQSEFLSMLMGITRAQAIKLISRNRSLKYIERSRLQQTIALLREMKYNYSHILQHPKIFNIHPSIIIQRYQCLKEFGFSAISLNHVLRYPSIVRCSLHDLKDQGILAENINPLRTLIGCTCGPPDLKDKLRERYGNYLLTSSLEKMRCAVVLDYLSWQLNSPLHEVCHLMEHYPILSAVSLQNLHRIWTVLTRNCSFNVEIIKNNGFLLTLKPNDVLQLLQQFTHLGGLGIKVLALECPKLLAIPGKRLGLSEDILHKFGVTDDQISRCAEIFLIDPAQLHNRLSEIKSIPELGILQVHPQFLWMVFTNASFKGKPIKGQKTGIGEVILSRWCSSPSEILRTHTIKQHDEPPEQHELEMYLSDRLNTPLEKIKIKLMFNMEWTKLSLQKTSELMSFLEQMGFTYEQIFNALPHLLTKNELLPQKMTEVLSSMNADQFVESFSQPNGLLNLISRIKNGEDTPKIPK